MRAERWLGWLLVLCVALAPARAGEQRETCDGVELYVRTPWPDMIAKGWYPMFFELANTTAESVRVELALENGWGPREYRIEKTLELGGGERIAFELSAPAQYLHIPSAYSLRFSVDGERRYLSSLGSAQVPEPGKKVVLLAVGEALPAGDAERWSAELSKEAAPRFSAPPSVTGGFLHPSARATATEIVNLTPLAFADLASSYECYTSADAVVIDTRQGLPPADKLAAIAAYARTGGVLSIYGTDAEQLARGVPELAAWMEPRFRVNLLALEDGQPTCYAMGTGMLLVDDDPAALERGSHIETFNACLARNLAWVPSAAPARGDGWKLALPGLELPIGGLALVLLLFALVIGPLNLWLVKRSGRPVLLLVTVPLISLVFSLGLFGYGWLAQGLSIDIASRTFALLDQRSHQGSGVELRHTFVGSGAGDGLVPGAGTAVFGAADNDFRDSRAYTINLDEGRRLGEGFMPARTPVEQTFLVDRPARVRLDLVRQGDAWEVTNGLGVQASNLFLRSDDGSLWYFEGTIEPGDKVRLVGPLASDDAIPAPYTLIWHGGQRLPHACYAVTLAAPLLRDACGVDFEEKLGEHVLIGVLPAEGQR